MNCDNSLQAQKYPSEKNVLMHPICILLTRYTHIAKPYMLISILF